MTRGYLTVFPYAVAFAAGFVTMAYEMLLGIVFTASSGAEIYTWGALITVFLLGMTVGYFLGGFLSDRARPLAVMPPLLLLAAALMGATPALLEPVCLALLRRYEEVQHGAIVASGLFAFVPAALLIDQAMLLAARADLPIGGLNDFIAHLRANASRMQYASAGFGSPTHLACALLNSTLGVDVRHVPYRGGSLATRELLAGKVDVSDVSEVGVVVSGGNVEPEIASGILRFDEG